MPASGRVVATQLCRVATRNLQGVPFGGAPPDPVTLGLVAVVMAAVGIIACWIPALPAAKNDPWVAVRIP